MGNIPCGGFPCNWTPTIRFEMAVDANNEPETTYLTAVRYYLANLGTTVESQVRSSVYSVYSVYSAYSVFLSGCRLPTSRRNLFPLPPSLLRLAVCHAPSAYPLRLSLTKQILSYQ